ncbi:hypothetical protein M3D47_001215 [Micrococcus luteus]|nr:hypothetical protein [Micrococcus luteus]
MARTQFDLYEEDRTGAWWADLDSGRQLALVSDGGWRMSLNGASYPSRYRLFDFDGVEIVEQTEEVLGRLGHSGHFDLQQEGAGRYQRVWEECVSAVEDVLHLGGKR